MSVTITQAAGSPATVTIPAGTLAANLDSIYSVGFTQRCASALVTAAGAVLGEDATVLNFASRRDYARLVIGNPATLAAAAIYAITADGVTGYGSSDQDLLDRILAIWPILSFGD